MRKGILLDLDQKYNPSRTFKQENRTFAKKAKNEFSMNRGLFVIYEQVQFYEWNPIHILSS